MKKIAVTMIAGLFFIAGVACGGGSSWSEADKAQLAQGKTLAISLGVLTEKQAECYGDWIQNHYDSMADATADESDVEAQTALNKACKINAVVPKNTTVTTTKANKAALCEETLENVTDGLNTITDGLSGITSMSSADALEFLDTSKKFVEVSIESVQLCAEFAPSEAAIALNWLYQLEESLTNLQELI